MNHDPVTGEILSTNVHPHPTAADGRALTPPAASIADFLRFLEDGQFNLDAGGDLRELVQAMRMVASNSNGKAKGKITLTIDLVMEGNAVFIRADSKTKAPAMPRAKTLAFPMQDGRLSPHPENQGVFFGDVKVVNTPTGPHKTVG